MSAMILATLAHEPTGGSGRMVGLNSTGGRSTAVMSVSLLLLLSLFINKEYSGYGSLSRAFFTVSSGSRCFPVTFTYTHINVNVSNMEKGITKRACNPRNKVQIARKKAKKAMKCENGMDILWWACFLLTDFGYGVLFVGIPVG